MKKTRDPAEFPGIREPCSLNEN